jgi:hypothetical protein
MSGIMKGRVSGKYRQTFRLDRSGGDKHFANPR